LLSGIVLLSLVTTACTGAGATPSPSAAPASEPAASEPGGAVTCPASGTKIGYSPLTMEFEWFTFVVDGIEEEAAKCGVEVVVFDPKSDAQAQASGVESMLASGVKAVAISAVDGNAIKTVVDDAHSQGVPVVQHVSEVPGADANVGVAEVEFGRQIGFAGGKWLAETKPDKAMYKIAILNADSLGAGLLDRRAGLLQGLEESIPAGKYEVVSDVEAWAEDTALNAGSTILQGHPDLDLFLTVNDVGALGALAAIEAAGLTPGVDVMAAGSLTKRGLEAMVAGKMPGGPTLPGATHGVALAKTMFALLAGEEIDFDQATDPIPVFTKEDAQFWLDAGGI
jgi:ribose transport system substrate-binding protein